jgi:hypothetical protein
MQASATQPSPLTILSVRRFLDRARMGVLDVAVITAALVIGAMLVKTYLLNSQSGLTSAANDSPPAAAAGAQGKEADPKDPPKKEKEDATELPKTPEEAVAFCRKCTATQNDRQSLITLSLLLNRYRGFPGTDVLTAEATKILLEKHDAITIPGGKLPSEIKLDPDARGPLAFPERTGVFRDSYAKHKGGNAATEKSVNLALDWLARHQEANGQWMAKKWDGLQVDTAVTSLALLAFLGAGHTEWDGQYSPNVRQAVAWLISKQNKEGLIFDTSDEGGHRGIGYPHAIATLALSEAAGMGHLSRTRKAAQAAVDYCCTTQQNSDGGWRYAPASAGDLSVSAWYIAALKSAKIARLKVPAASIEDASRFLDSVQKMNDLGVSVFSYMPGGDDNPRRNMMGAFSRMALGVAPKNVEPTLNHAILRGGYPAWGPNGETSDLYFWYYGSMAAFQIGGQTWTKWYDSLEDALLVNQVKLGDNEGSWAPVGAFANEWGRAGQTAFACLSLEAPYRYVDLNRQGDALNVSPKVESVSKPKVDSDDIIRTQLKTKVSFHFINKPMINVVEFLNDLTQIKVTMTDAAKKDALLIDLNVREMDLETSVDWICRLAGLGYRIDGDRIIIDVLKADEPKDQVETNKEQF